MVMGILTGTLNVNKVASDIKEGFDKATLTMQEKAEGTVNMMERIGITP